MGLLRRCCYSHVNDRNDWVTHVNDRNDWVTHVNDRNDGIIGHVNDRNDRGAIAALLLFPCK